MKNVMYSKKYQSNVKILDDRGECWIVKILSGKLVSCVVKLYKDEEQDIMDEDKIKILAKNNEETYDILKLAEELTEASEVLIKMVTKPNNKDKRMPLLIEELGDVNFRMEILIEKLQISKEVKDRASFKLDDQFENYKQGKYKNY